MFQLALAHSPPLSEIFVFTDASAKDAYLYDAVKALALEKQTKVGLSLKKLVLVRLNNLGRKIYKKSSGQVLLC